MIDPSKYPYKTAQDYERCAEMQAKADRASENIRFAVNKKLAVKSFLNYLLLSI